MKKFGEVKALPELEFAYVLFIIIVNYALLLFLFYIIYGK